MTENSACKQCNGPDITFGYDKRVVCNACNNIYLNDTLPEVKIDKPFSKKKYPECFTNYNHADKICNERCKNKKICLTNSPPVNYFKGTIKSSGDGIETVCPNCGTLDKGKFCSNCGSELQNSTRKSHITIDLLKSVFSDWPAYFRTVYFSIFRPDFFFSGAFSKQSALFFSETKTLDPINFFFVNSTFVAIASFLCNYFFFNEVEDGNFFSDLIDLALILGWMYVPALFVGFFVKIGLNKTLGLRKKGIFPFGNINLNNILRATIYTSTLDILVTPLILSIDEDRLSSFDENPGFFFSAFILALIARIISQMILLPQAIKYSCGIPKAAAQYGVNMWFMIPMLISQLFKLLQ